MNKDKPFTFDRVVRMALSAAILVGLIFLLNYLSDVLIPFAVALILAYMMNPLVLLIQKKVNHRGAAVTIALFLVFLVLAVAVAIVVPMMFQQAAHMGQLVSELVNNSQLKAQLEQRLPKDIGTAIVGYLSSPDVQDFLSADSISKLLDFFGRKVLPGFWGFLSGTASFFIGLMGLVVILLYLVFLLMDYQRVRDGWKDLIPPGYRKMVVHLVEDFDDGMRRYFRGQALVAFSVGIIFAVGFTLTGLPMGILFGLFVGLLNMVPYLQIVALVPALVLATIQALDTGTSIWITSGMTMAVFAIAQAAQDGFLTPRIMGKVTGLSPAMILLSLSIWGKLLGMLGLLIALPVTVLLLAYYRRFLVISTNGGDIAEAAKKAIEDSSD